MALSLQRYTGSDGGLYRTLKERSKKEREMSIAMVSKIGHLLPEEVIIEILSWLPVKTLLQFKCVCKSWYAIITSLKFISKHLKNTYNSSDTGCLLAQYYVTHAELQLFELLVDETPRVLGDEVLYDMPMYGSYVCGPCDGIYYLYHYDDGERSLWNPTINEFKKLPPIINKPNLPSNICYAKHDIYGFGLDPVTRDYKVVVIKGYWSTTDVESEIRHPLSVLVYSLRTDSWKYWGDLARDYFLDNNKCYICVNGAFYWLGLHEEYGDSEVIISFDMATDTYREIEVPDYDKPASKSLAVYHDSIALVTVHETDKFLHIWTLNEGCWTRKVAIGPFSEVRNPVGHWKNDKLILESDYCKLLLCDPSTQEIMDLGYEGQRSSEGIFVYKESLVPIKNRNESGQHKEAETESSSVIHHSIGNLQISPQ